MTTESKKLPHIVSEEEKPGDEQAAPVKRDPTDIFNDLGALRKATKITVDHRKLLLNVTVGRPSSTVHVRTHRELAISAKVVLQKDGTRRIYYFVDPYSGMDTHPKLIERCRAVTLTLTYTWPGGEILLWPVPQRVDFKAWKTERDAALHAQTEWVQIAWSEMKGEFEVTPAENLKLEPQWPKETFEQILKVAFSDRIIDNENHPYVKELRGVFDE